MKSTSVTPERIVAMGLEHTGKTKGWADIAAAYRADHTPGTFYVLAGDSGCVARLQDEYGPEMWSNIVSTNVRDWESVVTTTHDYLAKVVPGDWIIVENMRKPWNWLRQSWERHVAKQKGIDLDDMFATSLPPETSGAEYNQRINPEYERWFAPLMDEERNPAHVYMTCHTKPLKFPTGKAGEWVSSPDNRTIFSWVGVEPEAQKWLAKEAHTVLLFASPRQREYTITSVKDRGRELLTDQKVVSFPLSYLMRVGGWQ